MMFFESLEQAEAFLLEMFDLTPPITHAGLKRAFRKRVLEVHPDHAGGDNGDAFIAVKEAFDALMVYPELFDPEDPAIVAAYVGATTDDGTPLSSLGNGLGKPEANTRICETCHGRGWIKNEEKHFEMVWGYPDCWKCFGTGGSFWSGECTKCGGDGKFKKHGKRWVKVYISTTVHKPKKCEGCGGTGETRLANPVIPPGLLLGLQ